MKKKILIGVICAIVVIALVIAAIFGFRSNTSSPKGIAKNLPKALASEEKLEKFLEKNMDFKALAAVNAMDSELTTAMLSGEMKTLDDYTKMCKESFKKAYDEVTDDQVNEQKEALKQDFAAEEGSSFYKAYVKSGYKFKSAGELVESKLYPMFKEMKVTYSVKDGEDENFVLLFNEKKLVRIFTQEEEEEIEAFLQILFGENTEGGQEVETPEEE